MTLSSFVLILFDAERKEVLKAALTYLVMMHLGFFALLIGFVVLQAAEGSADFGALAGYFAAHRPAAAAARLPRGLRHESRPLPPCTSGSPKRTQPPRRTSRH